MWDVGGACILLLIALILVTGLRLLPLHRARAISLSIHQGQLLLVRQCILEDLLSCEFRRDQLHRTSMRLTATSGCEVLKTNLLLIAGLCIIDLAKLVLSHLHHLALVLDLPLCKFEGLAGHCIT